jgi:hypothetical protein
MMVLMLDRGWSTDKHYTFSKKDAVEPYLLMGQWIGRWPTCWTSSSEGAHWSQYMEKRKRFCGKPHFHPWNRALIGPWSCRCIWVYRKIFVVPQMTWQLLIYYWILDLFYPCKLDSGNTLFYITENKMNIPSFYSINYIFVADLLIATTHYVKFYLDLMMAWSYSMMHLMLDIYHRLAYRHTLHTSKERCSPTRSAQGPMDGAMAGMMNQ